VPRTKVNLTRKTRAEQIEDSIFADVRPPNLELNEHQLRAFCRLKPTKADCAAFFRCSEDKIEVFIKKISGKTFTVFRDENMVETRYMLVRTALQQAKSGNTAMLIFCLKNICKWTDKSELSTDPKKPFIIRTSKGDIKMGVKPDEDASEGEKTK
jgi:hypothetical protein